MTAARSDALVLFGVKLPARRFLTDDLHEPNRS
jgi:hypothetical protein